jgi:hypothetical protein
MLSSTPVFSIPFVGVELIARLCLQTKYHAPSANTKPKIPSAMQIPMPAFAPVDKPAGLLWEFETTALVEVDDDDDVVVVALMKDPLEDVVVAAPLAEVERLLEEVISAKM